MCSLSYLSKDSYSKTVARWPEIRAYLGDLSRGSRADEECLPVIDLVRCNPTTKELRMGIAGTLKPSSMDPPWRVRVSGVLVSSHLNLEIGIEPGTGMNATLQLCLSSPQNKVVMLGDEATLQRFLLGDRAEMRFNLNSFQ